MQIARFSEGLLTINSTRRVMGDCISGNWASGTLRKAKQCALCHHLIGVGERAWHPIGNGNNRWMRICCTCLNEKVPG